MPTTKWVEKVGQKQEEISNSLGKLRKKYQPPPPPPPPDNGKGRIDLLAKLGLLRPSAEGLREPPSGNGGRNPFRRGGGLSSVSDTRTAHLDFQDSQVRLGTNPFREPSPERGDTNPFRRGRFPAIQPPPVSPVSDIRTAPFELPKPKTITEGRLQAPFRPLTDSGRTVPQPFVGFEPPRELTTVEARAKARAELPTLTWLNRVEELGDNPTELVPFIGSGVEIVTVGKLLKTANDLENNREVSRDDLLALKEYVDRANQDTTWGYKVADVIAQLPAFAGEFLVTGGIYSAGKTATVKAGTTALKKLATKTGAKMLEGRLARYGVEAAGVLAGGALRTVPAGVTAIPAATLEKQLVSTLTGDEESVWQSASKALGERMVETVSEQTGGLFTPLTAPVKGQLVKLGIFKALQKANPTKSATDLQKIMTRLGYHGVLNEMLEERVADVGHGILEPLGLSDQEFKIPSLEQLGIELVAFSVPGAAMIAIQQMPGVVGAVKPVIKEALADESGRLGRPTPESVAAKIIAGQKLTLSDANIMIKDAEKVQGLVDAAKSGTATTTLDIPKPTRPLTEAEKPVMADYYRKEAQTWRDIALKATDEMTKAGEQKYAYAIQKAEAFEKTASELLGEARPVTPAALVTPEVTSWYLSMEGKPIETQFTTLSTMTGGGANLLQTPEGQLIERIATGKQRGWWKTIIGETEYVGKTPERVVEIARERGAVIPKAKALVPAVKIQPTETGGEGRLTPSPTQPPVPITEAGGEGGLRPPLTTPPPTAEPAPAVTAEPQAKKVAAAAPAPEVAAITSATWREMPSEQRLLLVKERGLPDVIAYRGWRQLTKEDRSVLTAKPVAEAIQPTETVARVTPEEVVAPEPAPAVTAETQAQKVAAGEAGAIPPTEPPVSADQEVIRQLGELQKMADLWKTKIETMEATRVSLAKFVRENLPTAVRGKFVTAVARVKTDAQLQTQLARVAEVAEANAQKVLKAEITKALRKTVAKKQGAILKSRYTPEVQKFLDTIRQNLHKDRAEILAKIAENMAAIDAGAVNSAELAHQNELLSLAGIDGMDSTQLAEVLSFIKTEKAVGLAERLQQRLEAKTAKEAEHLLVIREITGASRGGAGGESGVIAGRESGALEAQAKLEKELNLNFNRNMDTLFQLLTSKSGIPWDKATLSKFYNKNIFTPYHDEEIMRMGDFTRKKDSLKEILGIDKDGELNKELSRMANDKINLGTFKLVDGQEIGLEFTTNEMIAFYNWFQDSGLDKTFSEGMKWTPEIRAKITDTLTDKDKAVADWLIKDYEEFWQRANPIYRARYGIDLPRRPKYSPRNRDFLADVEDIQLIFQEMHDYGQKLPSAIKATTPNIITLKPTDALKAHDQHIITMDAWIARSGGNNNLRGLLGDKQVRIAIEQNWGKKVLAEIDHNAQIIIDSVDKTAKIYRLLDTVRGNFSTAVLANPKQFLNQIPTFLYGLTEMSPMTMANGLRSFWADPLANVHELMTEHPYMIVRYQAGNIERDMKTALAEHPSLLSPLPRKVRSILFTPMMLGDKFGTMQAYWAKYQEGLANGLSVEEAKTEAGRMSDRIQNTGAVYTLTSLQNAGSIGKAITAYQSQPNKMFQILDNNIRNLRYHRGNQAQAWLAIVMVTLVMTALFQFTQDAFRVTKRQLTAWNPARNLLVVGQMVQFIESLLVGDNFQYQAAPVLSIPTQTGWAIQKALSIAKKVNDPNKQPDPEDWVRLAETTGKPLGEVLGLPFPYIIQVEQAVRDEDARGLIFSRFALQKGKTPAKTTPAPVAPAPVSPAKSTVPPRRKLSDLAPSGTAPSRSQSGGTVPPRRKLSDLAPAGAR